MPKTPFDPRSGTFLPLADMGVIADFTVVAEGVDALSCTDRSGKHVLVAKPRRLRKSSFHGLTIDGKAYSLHELTVRDVTDPSYAFPDTPWYAEFCESYYVGEVVTAFKHHEQSRAEVSVEAGEFEGVDAATHLLWWEDLNLAARRWDSGETFFFEIETEHEYWLDCLDAYGRRVYVAKPARLRSPTYDGVTRGGVTFTAVDDDELSATDGIDTETWLVTPSYYAGEEILCVRSSFVDPDDGFRYAWEEVGAGRDWAVEP